MKRLDMWHAEEEESPTGLYVEFADAQAEIDSRDKRIAELETSIRQALAAIDSNKVARHYSGPSTLTHDVWDELYALKKLLP